ncbi:hypothetical protein IE53DRAFT_26743 [Violaceomyces palustris]|uniref:Uncharacterized protein n=1 Tax=Violaceomyces palustris TaxID=1673888 RepID=A0ACD0P1U6_9BASI|nr:hypothetical protein IE53DRAFT_26743 [Violaceomyces palustris]
MSLPSYPLPSRHGADVGSACGRAQPGTSKRVSEEGESDLFQLFQKQRLREGSHPASEPGSLNVFLLVLCPPTGTSQAIRQPPSSLPSFLPSFLPSSLPPPSPPSPDLLETSQAPALKDFLRERFLSPAPQQRDSEPPPFPPHRHRSNPRVHPIGRRRPLDGSCCSISSLFFFISFGVLLSVYFYHGEERENALRGSQETRFMPSQMWGFMTLIPTSTFPGKPPEKKILDT